MEINFPELEKKILEFWRENKVFERSIERRKKAKDFVFYDGPPTANAKPGFHHVLSRSFKDIIPRYKTMRGFRVLRKAGWDTHGLPVELEIEKKLGLKTKKDIEKYGIAKFNEECRHSVWQYKKEWEKLTERTGFWLDMENPYITYTADYIETVWFILKEIHKKGLLYQDYKVVPYCPRCQTSLSSHEVALGYKEIETESFTTKFKLKSWPNRYILGWTTTPWTTPSNVALAVNPKIDYVVIKLSGEEYVVAKTRVKHYFGDNPEIIEEFKGDKLNGLEYEPLFGYFAGKLDKPVYKVVMVNYATETDGTGIVHTAPAFGEDDYQTGKKYGLAFLQPVSKEGLFTEEVSDFQGRFVIDCDKDIINMLESQGKVFSKEKHRHDYPFCWRCQNPLLYFAKQAWFISMKKVKDDLISNNQKINWFPEYLKEGRMGEWLREVKDWTLSRERYWGTPLPVWRCKKCKKMEVIGSLRDLISQKFSTNNYYLFRHGHSLRQVKNVASAWPEETKFPLTEEGKAEVLRQAKKLASQKIDLIFSSDLLRTKQTAEIISKETGAKIIYDKELREVNVGIFNGKDPKLYWAYVSKKDNPYLERVPEGESLNDVRKRMYRFLEKTAKKYQGKNIVIVSHEFPLSMLEKTLEGMEIKEFVEWRKKNRDKLIRTGSWRKIEFKKLPFNPHLEIDFHRPYVDEVRFSCPDCGERQERVPEVIDCWFDSGSMPFAQGHWPFNKTSNLTPPKLFPADYISEGVDQTRGWFYTLLAISTLLGFGPAYKNVISLGHVLDEKGEKMSKSKGNVVDPWQIIEKYGADAVRWCFYTLNQPGDSKLFAERDVDQTLKKFILTLWNCFTFLETYGKNAKLQLKTKNLLDKWIISKLNGLILETTQRMDNYDVTSAARAIENFVVNDLSLWYVRRSRRRFQRPETDRELKEASENLGYILLTLSKLTAPFIPFLSEEIYRGLTYIKAKPSVHLEDWPEADKKLIDKELEEKMIKVRELVNLGLRERARLGSKVRQPLRELAVKNLAEGLNADLIALLKEEINVKNIRQDPNLQEEIKLDATITEELREEGIIREIIRNVQEMRKKAGLKPADKIKVWAFGTEGLNEILVKNKKALLKEGKIKELLVNQPEKGSGRFALEKDFQLDNQKLQIGIRKEK